MRVAQQLRSCKLAGERVEDPILGNFPSITSG